MTEEQLELAGLPPKPVAKPRVRAGTLRVKVDINALDENQTPLTYTDINVYVHFYEETVGGKVTGRITIATLWVDDPRWLLGSDMLDPKTMLNNNELTVSIRNKLHEFWQRRQNNVTPAQVAAYAEEMKKPRATWGT